MNLFNGISGLSHMVSGPWAIAQRLHEQLKMLDYCLFTVGRFS